MLGFLLLQLVDPLDEGAERGFHGALIVNLHGSLDGRHVGGGCGGRSVCLLDLKGGKHTDLAQRFDADLIPRPTELPKLVIKVADPPMQVVGLGPNVGQPGVRVPRKRADEGHGFLLHGRGLGGEASLVVGQGVELLPLLLHFDGFGGRRFHGEGPLA